MNLKKKESINLYITLAIVIISIIFLSKFPSLKSKIKDYLEKENQINLTDSINDGIYWYNGSDYHLPLELIIRFNRVYNVFSVNFFSDGGFPKSEQINIFYLDENKDFQLIPSSNYLVKKMGENLTPGGYFTDVYVLFFEKEIMTDSFKIVIEGSKEESSIYFREIGFYKGMEKEYLQEIQNYVRFQEIVNHRKAKQDSAEISFTVFQNQGSLEIFEENVDTIGIPLKVEGFTNGTGYHPSHICTYGLYLAYRYRRDPQKEDYEILRIIMNWIEENSVDKGSFITWEFNEDLKGFNVKAPWSSALTNAWCAGALLQGFEVTGEKHLEENAKRGLEYLFAPVEEGGGLFEYDDGGVWFEEVPNFENPSHILNGHIYALDSLDMFASYYGDERYKYYFNYGVASLKQRVKEYDVGYGSIYDLYTRGNQLGNHYHKIHYIQLYYIYLVTNDKYFLNLSRKWFELDNQSDYYLLE